MHDCEPVYLLAYQNQELIGRAALWTIRDEPLPIRPGAGRAILQAILRRWPLLICRSPLSNTTGLVLPPGPFGEEALRAMTRSALAVSSQRHCLFLLFDFLNREEISKWPSGFLPVTVSDPGMVLHNRWHDFEAYLAHGNKKDRQHYKRTLRATEKIGIIIEKRAHVPDVTAALELIRNVDRRHNNASNPWMRGLLENISSIDGTWLEARQNGKLVGGGALLEDNEAQMTTALGLADDTPYAYLLLTYASLEEAFRKKVRLLRWGSGAYDIKRSLGFEMELNNNAMVSSHYPILNYFLRRFLQGQETC